MSEDLTSEQPHVYTDGSASPNPGAGGWGAVRVENNFATAETCGGEPVTTNNRMELTAILKGLQLIAPEENATLWTDSAYAMNAITRWGHSWRRNGWRTRTGDVKNRDLVERCMDALSERPGTQLKWVKGHNGNRWNERADSLANAGREKLKSSDGARTDPNAGNAT